MLWSGKMLRQNCSCQNKQSEWYNDTSAAYPDPPPKFYQLGWSSVDSLNLNKERIIKSFTNTCDHTQVRFCRSPIDVNNLFICLNNFLHSQCWSCWLVGLRFLFNMTHNAVKLHPFLRVQSQLFYTTPLI